MAVSAGLVTVSTTAVALNAASDNGQTLLLNNTSANDADLGDSSVTAGSGYVLAGNATETVHLKPGDVVYAIRSGSSDATIAVLRT